MAAGDIFVFDEAKAYMIDGGWEATDNIKIALLTSASTPTYSDGTPALGDYIEANAGGNYLSGGAPLSSLGAMVTEVDGVMTFDDISASVSWTQNASNPADVRWGLIYNDTDAGKLAIAAVDLGSIINMTSGDLTITWNASGIFTIT